MKNNMLRNSVILLSFIILIDLFLNIYMDSNILNASFPYLSPSNGWEQRGQWGDILSGHFSALAFLAVAYSVYLQIAFNKQQKNLDSFKMAIVLIENLKNETILMTSKTNASLAETMLSATNSMQSGNKFDIVETYNQSFHDILLIESLFESIVMLHQELNTKQQNIISLKIRLIESDYRILAKLYFWCIIALHFEYEKFEPTPREISKTKILLEAIAQKTIKAIETTFENDYLGFINSSETINPYHDEIDRKLFRYLKKPESKTVYIEKIKKCYRKLKIFCMKKFKPSANPKAAEGNKEL